MFIETRLQLRWTDNRTGRRSRCRPSGCKTRSPAAARSGAADSRRSTFEFASDLDYVRGAHSWRTGVLLEGGSFTVRRHDQLPRHLHLRQPGGLRRRPAVDLQPADRRPEPDVLDAAGGGLRAGRLADRAQPAAVGRASATACRITSDDRVEPVAARDLRVVAAPQRQPDASAGSYGYFYDWIAGDLYKQTLLFDGVRQREINIVDPSYPIPGEVGVTPPTNRYLWSDDLVAADGAPDERRVSSGPCRKNSRLNAHLLRRLGPRPAARPQPELRRSTACGRTPSWPTTSCSPSDASSRSQSPST